MKPLKEEFSLSIDDWITESIIRLPDMLSSKDLVKLGVYKNMGCQKNSVCRGLGPKRVKHGKRWVYPRISVLLWMKEKAMRAWPQEEKNG